MKRTYMMLIAFQIVLLSLVLLIVGCGPDGISPPEPFYNNPYRNYSYWYRGQTHTHTLAGPSESGGRRLPVSDVIRLYEEAGYDFLAITDHNTVGTWHSDDLVIVNGCESGKSWENHLVSLGVSTCPEQCASCFWEGGGYPLCSYGTNQKRIDHVVLQENGVAILAHPSSRGRDCWPGGPLETGWSMDKLKALHDYHAVEINNSMEEWEFLLDLGRSVWGVAADDFHSRDDIGDGWIVVNSQMDPTNEEDLLDNIREGNFYAVVAGNGGEGPGFEHIYDLGNIVSVAFHGANKIRFFDCVGLLLEERAEGSFSYIPDDSRRVPAGYVRIELEDGRGNIAYSQPLHRIDSPACPEARPLPPSCSTTDCTDLDCCNGYHCCGERCYPNDMECP